jgi:hypothetical protein
VKSKIVIRLLIAALIAFQWQIAAWITADPEPVYAYDWTPADVTVTYHMSTGMIPITDLTLTDLGFVSVSANWTPGGNYTMLRGLRGGIPSSITDGELIYYGPLSSFNITGMQLDLYDYGVAAWTFASDNTTYLDEYDTASIGGDGVEQIANSLSVIGQVGIALTIFSVLGFFTFLFIRIDSKWGSPVLALVTAGISLMTGFYAADIIDGYYTTTGYGLALSVALIIYGLVCIGWTWQMMFTKGGDD